MKISALIWLEEIVEKLGPETQRLTGRSETGFPEFSAFSLRGEGAPHRRERVFRPGQTDAGRYVIVFFVYKRKQQALILSARDMTGSERGRYEKK